MAGLGFECLQYDFVLAVGILLFEGLKDFNYCSLDTKFWPVPSRCWGGLSRISKVMVMVESLVNLAMEAM